MARWWFPAGILLIAAGQAGVSAINLRLAQDDIRRATELARWPHTDAERAAFHGRYTFAVDGPTVEYFAVEKVEIITPFRRMELIAEEHARMNDLFARGGLQDAQEALRPWRDRVSIAVTLRFDLTKQIPDVPEADVSLEEPPAEPIDVSQTGIYSRSGDATWLVGGVIEAAFDIQEVSQTTQTVVVRYKGREVVRVPVQFAAVE